MLRTIPKEAIYIIGSLSNLDLSFLHFFIVGIASQESMMPLNSGENM